MSDDTSIEQDHKLDEDAEQQETEPGSPSPGESIFEQFTPSQPQYRDSADGMPVETDPPWSFHDALPPPLAPKTLACLAQEPDVKRGRFAKIAQCRFYKRMRVIDSAIPDLALLERYCTVEALRGINGASMHLRDCGILDCEFRDPPDPAAPVTLDAIDAKKIEIGKERVKVEGAGSGNREASHKIRGYRMFKTRQDAEAGKKVLDPEEFQEVSDD